MAYHVEISRDETGFWATVTGPGLPPGGDTRVADDVWQLCTDITLAIQEADPDFSMFRMIPAPRPARRFSWRQFWRPRRQLFGRA